MHRSYFRDVLQTLFSSDWSISTVMILKVFNKCLVLFYKQLEDSVSVEFEKKNRRDCKHKILLSGAQSVMIIIIN